MLFARFTQPIGFFCRWCLTRCSQPANTSLNKMVCFLFSLFLCSFIFYLGFVYLILFALWLPRSRVKFASRTFTTPIWRLCYRLTDVAWPHIHTCCHTCAIVPSNFNHIPSNWPVPLSMSNCDLTLVIGSWCCLLVLLSISHLWFLVEWVLIWTFWSILFTSVTSVTFVVMSWDLRSDGTLVFCIS